MTQRQRVKMYILISEKGRDGHGTEQGKVEAQVIVRESQFYSVGNLNSI